MVSFYIIAQASLPFMVQTCNIFLKLLSKIIINTFMIIRASNVMSVMPRKRSIRAFFCPLSEFETVFFLGHRFSYCTGGNAIAQPLHLVFFRAKQSESDRDCLQQIDEPTTISYTEDYSELTYSVDSLNLTKNVITNIWGLWRYWVKFI